jgi:acetyl esterase/lipase
MKRLGYYWAALAGFALAAHADPVKSNLVYGQADGQDLKLDACVPAGPGPFAAAILVHGGGWTSGDKRVNFAPLFDPLTKAGIAWFSINYRLAPKYRYPACLDDVQTAIRWVQAHAAEFHLDPRRIALVGESSGGQLVEMAALRAGPDIQLAAVVPFYAPCDLIAEMRKRGNLGKSMVALFGRSEFDAEMDALMHDASPLHFIHAGLPPFLLVHGTSDKIVPYDQSVQFQAALRAAGVACDLVTIANGLHSMGNWTRIAPHYEDQVVQWLMQVLHVPKSGMAVPTNLLARANPASG